MNASKIAIFPDTNLFLHYRSLNEIDWCSLLHSSTVEVEIAPVVARELEKQKTLNPSKKLRDRAATALKLLHKHLANPQVRDGVLRALISDTNSGVRLQALRLVEPMKTDSNVRSVLARLAQTDQNPSIRSQARTMLAQMPEMD